MEKFKELTHAELEEYNGGIVTFAAIGVCVGAAAFGYTIGKDLAKRK